MSALQGACWQGIEEKIPTKKRKLKKKNKTKKKQNHPLLIEAFSFSIFRDVKTANKIDFLLPFHFSVSFILTPFWFVLV